MSDPAEALEACFESPSPQWVEFLERFSKTPQRVAYYPSAYQDLRPFLYWKAAGLRHQGIELPVDYEEPNLWVFSDYFPNASSTLFDTKELHRDEHTVIRILDFCEICSVPDKFEYRVNKAYTDLPSSHATGKAVWFRAQVDSDRMGPYETDAIYFFYENVNLIDQLFMRHMVPVSHLAWKRDGAGLGGGRLIHGFLRFLSTAMRTRWFLLEDRYLDNYVLEQPWPAELTHWRERIGYPTELRRLGEFDWDGSDRVVFLEAETVRLPEEVTEND